LAGVTFHLVFKILLFSTAGHYLILVAAYIRLIPQLYNLPKSKRFGVLVHPVLCLAISGFTLWFSIKSCIDDSNLVLFVWVRQKIHSLVICELILHSDISYHLKYLRPSDPDSSILRASETINPAL
jgi:hypothetical protein